MLNFFINYAQIRAHFSYLVVFFAPAYMQYALTNNIYKLLALCFFSQKKVFNQIETQVQENSDICGFSK